MQTRQAFHRWWSIRRRATACTPVGWLLVGILLATAPMLPAAADPGGGELDELEKELEKEHEESETYYTVEDHEPDLAELLVEVLAGIFYEGGELSWHRMMGTSPHDLEEPIAPREVGEPLIPFVNVDLAYQHDVGDIEAVDGRLEIGWGPVGADVRWTRYRERKPRDAHDFVQSHLLYRMAWGADFEVDVGVGVYVMDGIHRHTGTSITLPIWMQIHRGLSVESRLGWAFFESTSLKDHSLRLRFGRNKGALWAGYRWVTAGKSTLRGPTIGLSLYY